MSINLTVSITNPIPVPVNQSRVGDSQAKKEEATSQQVRPQHISLVNNTFSDEKKASSVLFSKKIASLVFSKTALVLTVVALGALITGLNIQLPESPLQPAESSAQPVEKPKTSSRKGYNPFENQRRTCAPISSDLQNLCAIENWTPELNTKMDLFIEDYKKADLPNLSQTNSLKEIFEAPLAALEDQEIKRIFEDLRTHLFSENRKIPMELAYSALSAISLPREELTDSKVASAQLIQGYISNFFRANSSKDTLSSKKAYESYIDYLNAPKISPFMPLTATLEIENQADIQAITDLWHLQKHLTKKLTLLNNPALNSPSTETHERALKYLNLSWLHGTKASVIKSACENTECEIRPKGRLPNKKVLTGEMQAGATSLGINHHSLSGVNLYNAKIAMEYAEDFKLNINNEIKILDRFIKCTYNYQFLRDGCENPYSLLEEQKLSQSSTALRRVAALNPKIFGDYKSSVEKKLVQTYYMTTDLFKAQPNKFFGSRDSTSMVERARLDDRSRLYILMTSLREMEETLEAPLSAPLSEFEQRLSTIPLVVASSNRFGLTLSKGFQEIAEEVYPGALILGQDIKVVFTSQEYIDTVKQLLNQHGLNGKVEVESMEVLAKASELDVHANFYDGYNKKKWEEDNSKLM